MDNLFENLSMNVSEECFNDILSIIEQLLDEGIGKEIREKGKEKAVKDLINRKNNEIVDAYNNRTKAERLKRKAWEKWRKNEIPYEGYDAVDGQSKEASKKADKAFHTNLRYNYDAKATKGKVALPRYEETSTGDTIRVGWEKGHKKYTPKNK